jgi:hypothetical protein
VRQFASYAAGHAIKNDPKLCYVIKSLCVIQTIGQRKKCGVKDKVKSMKETRRHSHYLLFSKPNGFGHRNSRYEQTRVWRPQSANQKRKNSPEEWA